MKRIITLLIIACTMASIQAQVGINTNNTPPDSSAMLDVQSTSRGFLYPRMTTAQRDTIDNPTIGLTIYNLDDQCTDSYDGLRWLKQCGNTFTNGVNAPADFSFQDMNASIIPGITSAVAFTLGNKAYLGTGENGLSAAVLLKDFWEFDGISWNQLPPLPDDFLERASAVAFTLGNKAYVGAGRNSNSEVLKDFWEFDGTSWNQLPALPDNFAARGDAVAFTLGNKAYIGTGTSHSDANYFKDFWEFDGTNWSQLPVLPDDFSARGDAVAFTLGNKAFVGTGRLGNSRFKDFWEFDGSNWNQLPTLPPDFSQRSDAIAFTLNNAITYVGGGNSPDNVLDSYWRFDGRQWIQSPGLVPPILNRPDAVAFTLNNSAYLGTGDNSFFASLVYRLSPNNYLQAINSIGQLSWENIKWQEINGNLIRSNGRIGIGTENPTNGKLTIRGSGDPISYIYTYLRNQVPATGSLSGDVFSTIWADGRITAAEFAAISDTRVKNILGISNSQDDLATLMDIEITDYQHIDTLQLGRRTHKKVIAQQIAEVFPQAVTSRATEVVPDIYQRANLQDGWIELATDLQVGERVKIITETSNDIHEVIAVEDTRFQVSGLQTTASVSGDASAIPSTPYQVPRTVFVYGREVHDFHTVDYEAIAMLNVSATQEQQRRIEALEAANEQLLLDNTALRRLNQAFETRLNTIETLIQTQSEARAN
ncbi:MAG: tail fiber domain-containing protein [Bacteroidota bacterium]